MGVQRYGSTDALRNLIGRMDQVNKQPCTKFSERVAKKASQVKLNVHAVILNVKAVAKDAIVLVGVILITPVKLEILLVRLVIPGAYQDWHQKIESYPGCLDQITKLVIDTLGVGASTAGVALSLFKGSEWNVAMQRSLHNFPATENKENRPVANQKPVIVQQPVLKPQPVLVPVAPVQKPPGLLPVAQPVATPVQIVAKPPAQPIAPFVVPLVKPSPAPVQVVHHALIAKAIVAAPPLLPIPAPAKLPAPVAQPETPVVATPPAPQVLAPGHVAQNPLVPVQAAQSPALPARQPLPAQQGQPVVQKPVPVQPARVPVLPATPPAPQVPAPGPVTKNPPAPVPAAQPSVFSPRKAGLPQQPPASGQVALKPPASASPASTPPASGQAAPGGRRPLPRPAGVPPLNLPQTPPAAASSALATASPSQPIDSNPPKAPYRAAVQAKPLPRAPSIGDPDFEDQPDEEDDDAGGGPTPDFKLMLHKLHSSTVRPTLPLASPSGMGATQPIGSTAKPNVPAAAQQTPEPIVIVTPSDPTALPASPAASNPVPPPPPPPTSKGVPPPPPPPPTSRGVPPTPPAAPKPQSPKAAPLLPDPDEDADPAEQQADELQILRGSLRRVPTQVLATPRTAYRANQAPPSPQNAGQVLMRSLGRAKPPVTGDPNQNPQNPQEDDDPWRA